MAHAISVHHVVSGIGRVLEHAAFVVLGLIMLPLGITIGLLGGAIVVAGVFARLDHPGA